MPIAIAYTHIHIPTYTPTHLHTHSTIRCYTHASVFPPCPGIQDAHIHTHTRLGSDIPPTPGTEVSRCHNASLVEATSTPRHRPTDRPVRPSTHALTLTPTPERMGFDRVCVRVALKTPLEAWMRAEEETHARRSGVGRGGNDRATRVGSGRPCVVSGVHVRQMR